MSDEKIEIRLHRDHFVAVKWDDLVAALRAKGFELYRPDECEPVEVGTPTEFYNYPIVLGPFCPEAGANDILPDDDLPEGSYRLVPVPSGGEKA